MSVILSPSGLLYGVHDPKPIRNLPDDCKKVRLRMRNEDWVYAFVKRSDRIERWIVSDSQDGETWFLDLLQGINRF